MQERNDIFNKHNPYQSIVDFTNNYAGLLSQQQTDFMKSLTSFFATNAYNDKVIDTTERVDACFSCDVEVFSDVLEGEEGHSEFEVNQIAATVAKVGNVSTETLTTPCRLYQICLTDDADNDFWGWIDAKYVDGSEYLQEKRNKELIKLSTKDVSPATLFALRRLSELHADENNVIHTDLSYAAIYELMRFAVKMHIQPLKEELKEFHALINLSEEDKQLQAKIFNDQPKARQAYRVILQTPLTDSRFPEDAKVSFHWHEDGQAESVYFDSEKPYQSIAYFSRRCCALSKEDQLAFYSKVRAHFSTLAYQGKQKAIPGDLKRFFSLRALPFVLDTMASKRVEKLRFLYTIMRVANQSFPSLDARYQMRILKITYKKPEGKDVQQFAWLPEELLMDIHHSDKCSNKLSFLDLDASLPLNPTVIQLGANPSRATSKQLVALLAVAPKYFSKIGVNRIKKAVIEKLKDKRQKKRVSDALIEHILKGDDFDGVLSLISELESNVSFGTPKQLAELLVFVTENCSGKGKKRIEEEIVKMLKDSKSQQVMSNALCVRIEKSVVDELVGKYPDEFKPDPKLGGKNVLKKTFLSSARYFKEYSDFKKAVQSQLERTEHLDSILKDFDNQKWVKQYYKDSLIEKARIEINSRYGSELLELLREEQTKLYSVSRNAYLDDLFTCIKREKELCKKAGLESYRKDLLRELRKQKKDVWVTAFMKEFFPKLNNESNEYKVLKSLLKEWCKKEANYTSISSKRAKELKDKYPIRDPQQIVAILELLIQNKETLENWAEETVGSYSCIEANWIIEEWNKLYKASYIQAKNSLEPLETSSIEAKFLSEFLYLWSINQDGRYPWNDSKTTTYYLEKLRETFPNLADQKKVMQFILNHPKVQTGLKALLPASDKSTYALIEKVHKGLETAVEVDLKIQFFEGRSKDKFKKFMDHLISEILIFNKPIGYNEMGSMIKEFSISRSLCLKAWRRLQKDIEFAEKLKNELNDEDGTLLKNITESLNGSGFYFEEKSMLLDLVEKVQVDNDLPEEDANSLEEILLSLFNLNSFCFNDMSDYQAKYQKEGKENLIKMVKEKGFDFSLLHALCQSEPFQKLKKEAKDDFKKRLIFFEGVVSSQIGVIESLMGSTTAPKAPDDSKNCIVS